MPYAPAGAHRGRAGASALLVATLAVGTLCAGALTAPPGADAAPGALGSTAASTAGNGKYVVVLARPPAASYRGGTTGIARTAPRPGARYDATSSAARAYTAFLRDRQDQLARAVGAEPFYHYTVGLDGFAAELDAQQARRLAGLAGVLAVVPDRERHLDGRLTATPTGLTAPQGAATLPAGPRQAAGRGIVIGIVDSGIDSDSRSFAATGRAAVPGFTGRCRPGVDDDEAAGFTCSTKLVGGDYFLTGQGGPGAISEQEFLSPEDYAGHGSLVASAAAGGRVHDASPVGVGLGMVSGTAPGAAIASYKACWTADDQTDSCLTSDSVAAIDQAVADGVDVISYAISGPRSDLVDPVELAFMYAADAGVFVAASAGNDGPAVGSVAHPGPWVTTVGAATHYAYPATVVLGDGSELVGRSVTPDDVDTAPLVLARDAAAEGADEGEAQLCFPDSLDPAAVEGAIVVCDRGTSDRVEKSRVVAEAGGVGVLLLNPTAGTLDADLHSVPTVHLGDEAYDDVYAYAEAADPTARIDARAGALPPEPPAIGEVSGRGPSAAAGGDVLKPDLVASGIDVIGAVAPESDTGRRYDVASGTSLAAAHVAGLAAVVRRAHPTWSPMAIKSAMMTTARDLTDTTAPFDQGAGLVQPRRFLDPGLVFDSGFADWAGFLAGRGYRAAFAAPPLRASNLNQPSIAVDELTGRETVRRTVTNVDDKTSTYSVDVRGFDGISVTAVPSVFTLAPGQRQTLTLRVVRDSADLGTYQVGTVRLGDSTGGHVVRLPIAVRPVGVRAPREVSLDGSDRLTTRSGLDGTLVAKIRGMVPGVDAVGNGTDTQGADFDPVLDGLWSQTIEVGGPAELVRVQTMPGDRADDLDLFVLDENGAPVGEAASGSAAETVTLRGLAAGTYTVYVQPWFVADPSGETTFTVRTFQVPRQPTGTLSAQPRRQEAVAARDDTWQLGTGRLRPATSYLGWIGWYRDNRADDELVGSTLVSVD